MVMRTKNRPNVQSRARPRQSEPVFWEAILIFWQFDSGLWLTDFSIRVGLKMVNWIFLKFYKKWSGIELKMERTSAPFGVWNVWNVMSDDSLWMLYIDTGFLSSRDHDHMTKSPLNLLSCDCSNRTEFDWMMMIDQSRDRDKE